MTILAGTCGWSYQEWVGAFYPNNRVAKLPFYSSIFNSVEVDSSFYKAPSKSMITGWIKATGQDFKFSLKIPKAITHDRRLAEIEKDSLESFLNLLPRDTHFGVEFRHDSCNSKEAWDLLEKYDVANTVTDSPIEFLARPVFTAATHSYVRWHGRGQSIWYDYTYSEQELGSWLGKLEGMEEKVPVVYAYFNNHYRASAPDNLLQLLEMRDEMTYARKKVRIRA